MPADLSWTTAAGAVAGGLIVAILNNREQRVQHLRTQMLSVADEFAVAMHQADAALLRLARDAPRDEEARDEGMAAWEALERAAGTLARVSLLFGPQSRALEQAIEAHTRLDTTYRWIAVHIVAELEGEMSGVSPDDFEALGEEIHAKRELAGNHMRQFSHSAFVAMRHPGRFRVVDRFREPLRRTRWKLRRPKRALRRLRTSRRDKAAARDEASQPSDLPLPRGD